MKKLLVIAAFVSIHLFTAQTAKANIYEFIPNPANLFNLDHDQYYTWAINWSLPSNQVVSDVHLFIDNINNWTVEDDSLYIHLLDTTLSGVRTYTDNQGGGDNFLSWAGNQTFLDVYSDPQDDPGPSEDYNYHFSVAQINSLLQYSIDGQFGLGFDPDCHYWNDGVKLTITTQTNSAPEPASLFLMGSGLLSSLGFLRKRSV